MLEDTNGQINIWQNRSTLWVGSDARHLAFVLIQWYRTKLGRLWNSRSISSTTSSSCKLNKCSMKLLSGKSKMSKSDGICRILTEHTTMIRTLSISDSVSEKYLVTKFFRWINFGCTINDKDVSLNRREQFKLT